MDLRRAATGALAGWEWDTANMVLVALAFGTLFTMMAAIGLDLLAPRGSLARGERAGLITVGNPLRGVRLAARPIRRYREVLQLARSNGVTRQRPTAQALPPGLSQTLEQAGGMFVKLGQVASTRPDLLPPEWCDELARLRSQAEPASEESIRPVLEVELGRPVDQLYGSFDWRPMASASIAQVYPAELPDGRAVVVKVQRPGLDELIARDGGPSCSWPAWSNGARRSAWRCGPRSWPPSSSATSARSWTSASRRPTRPPCPRR